MPRVNILKQIKVDDRWRLVSIPHDRHGRLDWKALPKGRYFVEWWEHGKRKREAASGTVADAQEIARRRKHILEGKAPSGLRLKRKRSLADRSTLPSSAISSLWTD